MRTTIPGIVLAAFLGAGAWPAAAQHGELQLGVVAAYGTPAAFGKGAGPVAGIALGRIVYFGARWIGHEGGTTTVAEAGPSGRITTRAQLYEADFGLLLPVGRFEVVPGFSLGAVRFRQPASAAGHRWEFVGAPTLAVHAYVAGLVLIPELQYFMTGDPEGPDFWHVPHAGWLPSVRLVIPIEIGRIRY